MKCIFIYDIHTMQAIIKLHLSSIFTLHEIKPSSHVADEFQTKTSHHAEEFKKTNQSDAIKVRPKEVYNFYNTFMQGFEVSAIIFCLGGQIIPHMEIINKLAEHWYNRFTQDIWNGFVQVHLACYLHRTIICFQSS